MKTGIINLLSFYGSQVDSEIFQCYKKINGIEKLKDSEIQGVNKIFEEFKTINDDDYRDKRFSGYFLGVRYKGVVSEEFDILRFSPENIINIELKSQMVEEKDLLRQLQRHSYLLSSISSECTVSLYTFVHETSKLYKLDEARQKLNEISFEQLFDEIPNDFIERNLLDEIDDTAFIISPYSEPERFFNGQYFLNIEQEEAKNRIIKTTKKYIGLQGAAGTGKSLILFDLAKELANNGKKVLFVFCSAMSDSTIKKIDQCSQFKFIDIRSITPILDKYEFDVVIIDESQRLKEDQVIKLINLINEKRIEKLILALDKAQTLKPEENRLNLYGNLVGRQKEAVEFIDCLTERVRTDKELATFIRKFFNVKEKNLDVLNFPKVNVVYFENDCHARWFIETCVNLEGFVSIEMPQKRQWSGTTLPKFYKDSLDGFTVIGREYDKVLIPLTNRVKHNEEGQLIVPVESTYKYLAVNGLFQAMTRVKSQLLLVVVKNKKLFKTIHEILTWKQHRDTQRIAKRIKSIKEVHSYKNETIAMELGISVLEYEELEKTGIFKRPKLLKKLARFYQVSPQYFEGQPQEIEYSKIDLIYRKKLEQLSRDQKCKIEQDIISFIEQWEE